MDDFLPKSPTIYNYFHNERTELIDTLLYEARQQDPVIRQLFLLKRYKNYPSTRSLTIRANKGLLHYYRRFKNLTVNGRNHLLYYIQGTTSPKICLPLYLVIEVELNLPLKATAVFEKQRATCIPLKLQDRVQHLLHILTHFDIISPVSTDSLTTGNAFINPVIIFKKENHSK